MKFVPKDPQTQAQIAAVVMLDVLQKYHEGTLYDDDAPRSRAHLLMAEDFEVLAEDELRRRLGSFVPR